jgi:hypothetical protein
MALGIIPYEIIQDEEGLCIWLLCAIRDIFGWDSILLNHYSEASGCGDWDGDWNGPDGVG